MRRDVKFVVAGQIQREFIIDVHGRTASNIQGGSALYAAVSIRHWGDRTGLISVVDRSYPAEDFALLRNSNLDTRGIKIADEALELRAFYAYPDWRTCVRDNPVAIYSANNLTYPKELLGYVVNTKETMRSNFHFYSRLLLEKIPNDYLEATAAHICPLDAACQIKLVASLEKGSVRVITIQPHASTMIPDRLEDVTVLAKDATAIYFKEPELRNLFRARAQDLREMIETVSGYGCRCVIVRNQQGGFYVYDAHSAAMHMVPDYPVRVSDPTGEDEVFCGAFLATYQRTYDPLTSAITGSAAASIKREGSGPFSIDASLPGLDKARMENIQTRVVLI